VVRDIVAIAAKLDVAAHTRDDLAEMGDFQFILFEQVQHETERRFLPYTG
jgi:hypothetical protein